MVFFVCLCNERQTCSGPFTYFFINDQLCNKVSSDLLLSVCTQSRPKQTARGRRTINPPNKNCNKFLHNSDGGIIKSCFSHPRAHSCRDYQ